MRRLTPLVLLALLPAGDARAAVSVGMQPLEAPTAPTLGAGAGVGREAAIAPPMHLHTMWGDSEWVDPGAGRAVLPGTKIKAVSYTHLRAHET